MLIDQVICYNIKQKLANIYCDSYKKYKFLYLNNYNILENTW